MVPVVTFDAPVMLQGATGFTLIDLVHWLVHPAEPVAFSVRICGPGPDAVILTVALVLEPLMVSPGVANQE